MEACSVRLGWRVCVSGYRGVVRFVGQLPGRGGFTWIGIDWDDPGRGRHDGTVDGVRYFETDGPTSGSFVKLSKLGDGGRRSLLQAVARRHSNGGEASELSTLSETLPLNTLPPAVPSPLVSLPDTVGGSGGRTKFVGVEAAALRQALVQEATALTLCGMGVCEIDEPDALSAFLANVKHLDLSESLISSVRDIFAVFHGLPSLESLNLSSNRFNDVGSDSLSSMKIDAEKACFSHMRVLVLNKCNLPWRAIVSISLSCPELEELRLHRSSLSSLDPSSVEQQQHGELRLEKLRVLDVDGNSLNWSVLSSFFGNLPSVESLYLGSNDITHIRIAEGTDPGNRELTSKFPNVTTLSLSGNPIADWQSFSELCFLPNLVSLRASSMPLLDSFDKSETETTSRLVPGNSPSRDAVISRIGSLRVLDGSAVHQDERMYAEKNYTTSVLAQFDGSTIPESIQREHPRITELCKTYDIALRGCRSASLLRGPGDISGTQKTLRRDLVECSFVNHGGLDSEEDRIRTQIPASISVGKLRGLAGRLFGRLSVADVGQLELVENIGGLDRLVDLDDETRDLRHYGLTGGDSIEVNVRGRHRVAP